MAGQSHFVSRSNAVDAFHHAIVSEYHSPSPDQISLHQTLNPNVLKATQIICNLCHDARMSGFDFPLPSTRLIRCLVNSHLSADFERDRYVGITWTLASIAEDASPERKKTHNFVELDATRPLFPNDDCFSLDDTYTLATSLINYLVKQTHSSI